MPAPRNAQLDCEHCTALFNRQCNLQILSLIVTYAFQARFDAVDSQKMQIKGFLKISYFVLNSASADCWFPNGSLIFEFRRADNTDTMAGSCQSSDFPTVLCTVVSIVNSAYSGL